MVRLKDVGVAARLYLLASVFVVGLTTLGVAFKDALETLRIQGPIDGRIVEGRDLVADILPPSQYVIEPYLVVLQASREGDPARIAALAERFESLRREYDARRDFWSDTLSGAPTRDALLERATRPARRFFDLAGTQYFPALLSGRRERADALASGPLRASYDEHRAAIEDLVKLATASQAAEERLATEVVQARTRLLVLLTAGVLVLTVALCGLIIRSVLTRVGGETAEAMTAIGAQISLLEEIAYQTKLLALNAAIKAARACEHGPGGVMAAACPHPISSVSRIGSAMESVNVDAPRNAARAPPSLGAALVIPSPR